MDRLNFRKKMAVFISLVMILQVVIGNVGIAEGGTEGGSESVATIVYYDWNNGTVKYKENNTDSYILANMRGCEGEETAGNGVGNESTLVVGKTYDILLTEKTAFPENFDWETGGVSLYGYRSGSEPVVRVTHSSGSAPDIYKCLESTSETNKIDNNSDDDSNTWHFTYTAVAGDSIEVFWSAFDEFGYDDRTQFQINISGDVGNGSIELLKYPDQENDKFEESKYGKKYNYPIADRENVKIVFSPNENCSLEEVWINGSRYDKSSLESESQNENGIFKLNSGNKYELTLTEAQIKGNTINDNNQTVQLYNSVFISANFRNNDENPNGGDTGCYIERYDGNDGTVSYKKSGESTSVNVDSNKDTQIETNKKYDFYLTEKPNYPDNWNQGDSEQYGRRSGSKPVVRVTNGQNRIEYHVSDEQSAENNLYVIDDNGDSESDTDNNTWHFTFNTSEGDRIRIYWSDYDAFEYDRENEFQICLQSRIDNGTVSFKPSTDVKNDDSKYGKKYNFSKEQLTNLEIIFTPNENCDLEKIRVEGNEIQKDNLVNSNGTYKYRLTEDIVKQNNEYRSIYIEPFFKSNNPGGSGESGGEGGQGSDNPEGGSGGTGSESIDENNANKIAEHGYAYYVNETDASTRLNKFKDYLSTELWNEYFRSDRPAAGLCGITTLDILKSRLTLEYKTKDNSSVPNLDYYEYKIRKNENAESTNTYLVQGNAYILENAKDFIVNIDDEYTVVNCSSDNNTLKENIYIKSNKEIASSDNITIFGNGVCGNRLDSASQFTYGFHITQEHSGLGSDSTIGNLGCKLIVRENAFKGLSIQGNRNAAAWDFNSTGVYDTGTQTNPAIAEVFYGNNSFTMEDIKFDNDKSYPNITSIVLDSAKISSSAAKIVNSNGEYTITFESGYDMIPLIISYNDGTIRYVTLNRVGLKIDKNNIDNNKFEAWHGTDHTVAYSATGEKAIYATFYYLGDSAPTSHVQLFATITKNDGTVERKMINNPLTGGTKPSWDERTGTFAPNKASQGTDKYLDDFEIWSGSDEEFKNIDKVEVIAYNSGDDNGFGGVKVGSDAGVVWINK